MFGYAPLSWDLPDGRTAVVRVDELRNPALRDPRTRFTVAYQDDPTHAVQCSSGGVSDGEGWFRCTGAGADEQPLRFVLGRRQSCTRSSLTDVECWRGDARLGATELKLDRGYLEQSGVVVGYVSWLESRQPVFAANLVVDTGIDIHDRGDELHERDADLLLLTVALHWFEHASTGSG